MTAVAPRITPHPLGFRATCAGCGEHLDTTRRTIAADWLRVHCCDPAILRARRLAVAK